MSKSETQIIIVSSGNYLQISETALKLQDLVTEKIERYVTWMREYLPTTQLDPQRIIMAVILSSIVNDDLNCFGFDYDSHTPTMLELAKHNTLHRMQAEIETPETPQIIRKQLKKTLKRISSLNWQLQDEFDEAKRVWVRDVRDFTRDKINHYAPFDEALLYFDAHRLEIDDAWSIYLDHLGLVKKVVTYR